MKFKAKVKEKSFQGFLYEMNELHDALNLFASGHKRCTNYEIDPMYEKEIEAMVNLINSFELNVIIDDEYDE